MFARARIQRRRGIMLHELLFVLVLVVVAGFAVATCSVVRTTQCSPVNSAKSCIAMLEDAVNMYVLAVGECPTNEQGLQALLAPPAELANPAKWTGPYLDKTTLPLDFWNHPYQYRAIGSKSFQIWSNGPNGKPGDSDDISTSL